MNFLAGTRFEILCVCVEGEGSSGPNFCWHGDVNSDPRMSLEGDALRYPRHQAQLSGKGNTCLCF